jgi:enoyl-[acyl-carrier-protein] reductase (NADH)
LAIQKSLARYMPTRRWQSPQEIGECVAFMCSESARFIVGQTIFAEGGVTIPMGSDPNWANFIGLYDHDEE